MTAPLAIVYFLVAAGALYGASHAWEWVSVRRRRKVLIKTFRAMLDDLPDGDTPAVEETRSGIIGCIASLESAQTTAEIRAVLDAMLEQVEIGMRR